MKTSVVGYPRIGGKREWKFAVEKYFRGEITEEALRNEGKRIRKEQWQLQKEKGIDLIPSNDFSFYDQMLDTSFLLNAIPKRYKELQVSPLDTYYAMARGYQKNGSDVKALPMKKWFNTNYHYIVPEITDDTVFSLNVLTPIAQYKEAASEGVKTKPVLVGPFTFVKLANVNTTRSFAEIVNEVVNVYVSLFKAFEQEKIEYLQIDEPVLVTDLSVEEIEIFKQAYKKLLKNNRSYKVLLQTYFGDVRDVYQELLQLPVDAIGLDFIEGKKTLELVKTYGFAKDKELFAGVVNGKNIWKNDYKKSLQVLEDLEKYTSKEQLVISTSCSLLHSPYTVANETKISETYKESLAFAQEKLAELSMLKQLVNTTNYEEEVSYKENQAIIERKKTNEICFNSEVRGKVNALTEADFNRKQLFEQRRVVQKDLLQLPAFPTTTIGSFPQTADVKKARKELREGTITQESYDAFIKEKTKDIVEYQESIGLDVLVHGEYERNDMVEYFGQQLEGFLFTQNGWVQSYGTRGVKPPIIFGDVWRKEPMTLEWTTYAQSVTNKPVKGMLTGPITILNWSFPREDVELQTIAYQIGLAIGEEVTDLERVGIKVIQIDEAALREKLPLRKEDWNEDYLDWAIKAFRLTNAQVEAKTQIHTHMCYSQFEDIVKEIEAMDVDVISIEAARSDSSLLEFLQKNNFKPEIGPGVYDIHSPRVPTEAEITALVQTMVSKLEGDKIWINPDCGLKTRGMEETKASLVNMVTVAKSLRKELANV